MAIFGKRQRNSEPVEPEIEDNLPAPDGEPGVDRDWDRPVDGPFDIAERPELDGLLDLGSMRIPQRPGMELRLDVEKSTQRLVGVTCGLGPNKVQLQAFAAPRSSGLWAEIRAALVEGLAKAGGSAEEIESMFGPALQARMPSRSNDGRVVYQPARFMGVDGPRWFLRVVINGPAAGRDDSLNDVLSFVRSVVVDRGDEPRPPRELLELRAPQAVVDAAAAKQAAKQQSEGQA
ncbi:DUF3710 domain-containing protein [Ornithinimicrobium sp. Arc0846-15]|nr:DUF3710 domain-containing protein [Ornithinimicrobium laminariae]